MTQPHERMIGVLWALTALAIAVFIVLMLVLS